MTLKRMALLLIVCCLVGMQVQAQSQRSPADYINQVNKLLGEAGRADLSDQEAERQRQRARKLAAQYAATVKARNPTGMDRLWLGVLYQLADDRENALATFRHTLKDPALIEEQKQQARLFLIKDLADAGRLKEAEALVAAIPPAAFNADEARAEAHEVLSIAYTKQGQMEPALRHEKEALAAARKSGLIPRIWLTGRSVAQLEVALGRKADAMKLLTDLKAYFERQARLAGDPTPRAIQTAIGQMDTALAQLRMLGQPAPELAVVKWIKQAPTTLARLRGKVVLLELWAAWCPDCRGMIPHLRQWHARYTKQGLKILPVTRYYGYNGRQVNKASHREEEAFLLKFKQLHNIPYGTGLDDDDRSFNTYHVRSIPHIAIIDRSGRVRFVFTWHRNPALCEYVLKRVLAQPVAASN